MATLLQNVQDALLELGLTPPAYVVGSTDTTARQMLALFNRVGKQLYTEEDWQFLFAETRFQTVVKSYTGNTTAGTSTIASLSSVAGLTTDFMVTGAGIPQDTFITSVGVNSVTLSNPITQTSTGATFTFGQVQYTLPADFDRIVSKTEYNKTNRWALIGPKDAQEWQWLKSSYITTGPRMRYRIIDNKFAVWPMPASIVTLGYEYVSKNWVTHLDTSTGDRFTLDTDVCLFPDTLMIMGAKLRFLEAKGLDSTAEANYFSRELSKFKAQNSGADTLSLAPSTAGALLTTNNLPDSNFGSVG